MKKVLVLLILGGVWVSTTGASLIDNDTKNRVVDLERQVNALQAQAQTHHDQQMKVLKDLANKQVELPPAPVAAAPVVMPPPEPVAPPPPPAPLIVNPPSVTVSVPGEIVTSYRRIEEFARKGLLVLAGGLGGLLVSFFIMMRWMEKRFRKLVFRNEMDNLREVLSSRKPAIKVHVESDQIVVANTGKFSVDQVRLAVGTTPDNFKIKMRPIPTINVSSRSTLPLPSGLTGDTLYASVQYKDAQTHKVYRDQFVLRIQERFLSHRFDDDITELVPLQEPSYQHAS